MDSEDKIKVYVVEFGSVGIPVMTESLAKSLSKRIERIDPYGGIPFIKERSMSLLDALDYTRETGVINGLALIEKESEV